MNKYLEKLAESKDSSDRPRPIGKSLLGIGLGVTAANLAKESLLPAIFKKTTDAIHDNHSFSDKGTIKKMIRDNKLNVSFNNRSHALNNNLTPGHMKSMVQAHSTSGYAKPGFLPSGINSKNKDYIVGVRHFDKVVNKDIIMHELGHAKDFSTHKRFKTKLIMGSRLSGMAAPLLLTNDKTKDYAVPVAAASQLPTIMSEVRANKHAYKGIKVHKGASAAKGFVKKIIPSQMGGYLAGAALTVGGVSLANKFINKLNSKPKHG